MYVLSLVKINFCSMDHILSLMENTGLGTTSQMSQLRFGAPRSERDSSFPFFPLAAMVPTLNVMGEIVAKSVLEYSKPRPYHLSRSAREREGQDPGRFFLDPPSCSWF